MRAQGLANAVLDIRGQPGEGEGPRSIRHGSCHDVTDFERNEDEIYIAK